MADAGPGPSFEGHVDYADLALRSPDDLMIPVRVRLEYGDRSTTELVAKLDTGAEACFFGPAVARQLDISAGGSASGRGLTAAGRFAYRTVGVRLVLPDWRIDQSPIAYHVDVHFADWSEPAYAARAVLGLRGFMDRFSIGIEESAQRLWWGRDFQAWPRTPFPEPRGSIAARPGGGARQIGDPEGGDEA